MSYLRHISTRRLLALLAATVAVLAGSAAAIALAAGGSGPTPAPKPLAQAVHDALAAPAVAGVTARISFTNHLIDAASLQGSDPLLTGAKGRLWATGDQLRLELQASSADGRAGDVQVLIKGDQLTVIESGTNTVYRAKLPQDKQAANEPAPSLARIQSVIAHLTEKATLSGAQPSDVAGRPAYTVRITPRHDGGLLGGAEVAWDAEHGVPLRAAVYANGAADPVLELKATDISFGKVAASDLAIPEPSGAHVVDLDPSAAGAGTDPKQADVTGLQAVQARVGFTVVAPDALVGLPRKEVKLVELDGAPGALVTYGQGLGGIAVLESPSKAQPQTQQKGGGGLSLPKISINGTSGQELDTALGTVVRFDRAGVGFVVAGSVPPTAAEAAARGL
jgi:outer membrane lipoprotein-sorting protein